MITRLAYIFFTGSIFGWILETVFRRFCRENKSRKWINPGFLVGPYLPLYGFGVCTLFLLAEIEQVVHINGFFISKIVILLIMAVCMTLLELAAGLIFVRGMNVKLWDYSKKPFNYKGIVCLEFSIYWLVLSAVYYVMIHPLMIDFTDILISNQACLYPLGILSGVFVTDVCYSIQIAAKIKSFAAENNILIKYEELKFNIRKYAEEQKEKYWFIFAFSSKITLNEHLKKYLETASPIKRLKRMVKQGRKQQEDVYESGNKNF